LLVEIKGLRLWKQDFERQIQKTVYENPQISLETTIKYREKRVRERRNHGTVTIDPAGIRAGREADPGESGRDRPEFCPDRLAFVSD
jgi:hypothetical protein